jgi:hypothetical protein
LIIGADQTPDYPGFFISQHDCDRLLRDPPADGVGPYSEHMRQQRTPQIQSSPDKALTQHLFLMNTSFENLKVGDTVAIFGRSKTTLAKVIKITKQRFTTVIRSSNDQATEHIFNKNSGRDIWCTVYAFIPTEQEIAKITEETERRRLVMAARFALKKTTDRLSDLSNDQLQALIVSLRPYYKKD